MRDGLIRGGMEVVRSEGMWRKGREVEGTVWCSKCVVGGERMGM